MHTDTDTEFLRRAIRLAMNGRGGVEPNPMVGCVIIKNGRIIGQGFHARYGGRMRSRMRWPPALKILTVRRLM